MAGPQQTDERLLSERDPARAGDAFEEFYRRHEQLIVAFHYRRIKDAALATELTAETFARALVSRTRFRSEGTGSAARWLYGIAGNVGKQYAQQAARQTRAIDELKIALPTLTRDLLAEVSQSATEERILAALELLPPEQREAIRSHVLEGDSYESIAKREGTSVPTVRKRVSRGLRALRGPTEEGVK